MSQGDETCYVDPDPVAIVSVLISATALILQFVQVRNEMKTPIAGATPIPNVEDQQLNNLEASLDDLSSRLRVLERSIERGSRDIDTEYYNAAFRVSASRMKIEGSQFHTFNTSLAYMFNAVSQLAQGANSIIEINPNLAFRIGEKLRKPLANTAEAVNSALAKGGSNASIISEAKQTIRVLSDILNDELGRKGN